MLTTRTKFTRHKIRHFANPLRTMADGLDRVVPSSSWGHKIAAKQKTSSGKQYCLYSPKKFLLKLKYCTEKMGEKDRCAVWGCDNDRRYKAK